MVYISDVDCSPSYSRIVWTATPDFNPASSFSILPAISQLPQDHAVWPAVIPKIGELLDSKIFVCYIHPAE